MRAQASLSGSPPPARARWLAVEAAPRTLAGSLASRARAWGGAAIAAFLVASSPAAADIDVSGRAAEARREELSAAIARDQARLKELLSSPRGEIELRLHADPELVEIATRLPGLQRELQQLRDRTEPPRTP